MHAITLNQWQEWMQSHSHPTYRAQQVFRWLHQHRITCWSEMSNVPRSLIRELEHEFPIIAWSVAKQQQSSDGTQKILWSLFDRQQIETVLIPTRDRRTLCLSTQVGCALACQFCASGLKGLKRNLSAHEIVQQVWQLCQQTQCERPTHLVFMGIGEPFQNIEHVLAAIDIFNHPEAYHIGARRITISTAGVLKGIERLAAYPKQVELAISLHAARDDLRSQLMPINRKVDIAQLLAQCRWYVDQTGRQITFEYVMLRGINDDVREAELLGKLLQGLCCKVNLIPFNSTPQDTFQCSDLSVIHDFQAALKRQGVQATVRTPRGRDIEAACGQLKREVEV